MIVNFKICEINQDTRKFIQTFMLIKKLYLSRKKKEKQKASGILCVYLGV
jgi:hypothetical protein